MRRHRQLDLLVGSLPILSAYVRRIAGNRQTASEVLQEVCVRILAGEGPEEPDRFLAYCCGIARHVLAYDWRMRKRARAQLPLEGEVLDEISAPGQDPEGRLDARAWMARAMVRVDRDGLELLVRRYVLEESGSELADQLDQSSAALRMRLMRLRTTLLASRPGRRCRLPSPPEPPGGGTPVTLAPAPRGSPSSSIHRSRAASRRLP